jgi:tetratricopeptide (TPR) repeat protein
VTLYELLTLRPAFDGRDRQELLRQIAFEEPPPPRRVDPAIPRELETVVLKAMSKEPEGRYALAQELADDLRRFLEHRPVKARRPTVVERAAKWSRRHAGAVGAAVVILILAVAGLLASTLLIAREQRLTSAALKAEAAERRRAQDRLKLGFQVLDELYVEQADKRLPRSGPLRPEDRDFLSRALTYYEQFARQDSNDPGVRAKVAQAHWRVGDILRKLGQFAPALNSYDKAVGAFERLSRAFPGEVAYKESWAKSLNDRGHLLLELDRWDEADQAFRRSIALKQELVGEHPADAASRELLGKAYNNLAIALARAGKPGEAEKVYHHARDLHRSASAASPGDLRYRFSWAKCEDNLGNLLDDAGGRQAEAEACYRQAVTLHRGLSQADPGNVEYRQGLVVTLNNLAFLLLKANRLPEAEASIREGLAVSEGLAREFPNLPRYRGSLADGHYLLGNVLAGSGRVPESEGELRRAVRLFEGLVADFPDVPDHKTRLEDAYLELFRPLYAPGRYGELRDLYRAAVKALPDSPRLRRFYTRLLATCADHRYREPEEAIRRAKAEVERSPQDGHVWNDLGAAYCAAGRPKDAIEALTRSTQLRGDASGTGWLLQAIAHGQQGDKAEAGRFYDKGVRWMEENRPRLPDPVLAELRGLRDDAEGLLGRAETNPQRDEEKQPRK